MPKDAPTIDCIEYLVFHKPLGDLQHNLTSKAGLRCRDSLLDNLRAFLEFVPSIDACPPRDDDDGDLDFALDWDITPPMMEELDLAHATAHDAASAGLDNPGNLLPPHAQTLPPDRT